MTDKKKNFNITFLRFVAILIVMFGHSIIIYDPNWGYFTSTIKVDSLVYIKHIINIIQMPLYFCISGFVFYYTISKYTSKIQILINKIKRLLVPYLFFGLFLILPIRYILKYPSYIENSFIHNVFYNIILGKENGHLWFLLTLFLLFCVSIFYKKQHSKLFDIVTLIILSIMNVFSFKFSSYIYYIFYYLIYFFIGILINKYHINSKIKLSAMFIVVSIIILIILNRITMSDIAQSIIYLCGITATLLVLFAIDFSRLSKFKLIEKISNNSFGLYLFHSCFIVFTFKLFPNINPFYMILINFVIIVSICYFLTYLIKKTRFKIIIGE